MGVLVLTILLAICWVAFVGIGYWQGGWRQVVFLAGMLFSYAVLTEWAVPNGHDLSTQFDWPLARTTTGIALLYLIGGTLMLGFLAGLVLERPHPLGARERQFGAAMGILNGGLLLALILRTLQSYAFGAGGGRLLHTAPIARFLIESIGYVLLVALVVGLVSVVFGLVLASRTREPVTATDIEPMAAYPENRAPVPLQRQPAHEEPRPRPIPPPVSPEPPARPPVREPVYSAEPIIDWPTTPPPGTLTEPIVAAHATHARPAPEPKAEAARTEPPLPLPAQPSPPRRVPPPMLYPVAELVATHPAPVRSAVAIPAAQAAPTLAPAAPLPVSAGPPPVVGTTSPGSAETPAPRPVAIPSIARPTSPPPGAQHPAFIPPTVTPPSQLVPPPPERVPTVVPSPPIPPADTMPPVVRELDVATQDAAPAVHEIDAAPQEPPPPVVREVDVTTQDVPTVVTEQVTSTEPASILPEPDVPVGEEEKTKSVEPALSPPVVAPKSVTETAPMPLSTAVPPSLPPVPASRADATRNASPPHAPEIPERAAQQEETAKPRPGFARVAVARQPGARAEQPPGQQPVPQPPAEPDPLQPPLPTGPRVHACPTCGYPVRDHARYCPNCGSRQRP
jgi:hypothetical protein